MYKTMNLGNEWSWGQPLTLNERILYVKLLASGSPKVIVSLYGTKSMIHLTRNTAEI